MACVAAGLGAQETADRLLRASLELEHGQPSDDASVLVLAVLADPVPDGARRLSVSFPLR